jgi:hypothetical protein
LRKNRKALPIRSETSPSAPGVVHDDALLFKQVKWRSAAKTPTRDEARRIAADVAKPPDLVK